MQKHIRRAHRAFKKYFIPHKGNKYHPHALHTHHTVLYAVLFTILKAVLIIVALFIPAEAFVTPDVLADQGAKIIARTNQVRIEQGLPELKVSSLLVHSAEAKAIDMEQQGYFSHVSPDGHRLSFFLAKAGYPYIEAGENLAMGFSDADGAMNGWMKSPTHYANLVDPAFREIGVGIEGGVYQGKPTVFVAQHFGTRRETLEAAPTEKIESAPAPVEPKNQHPAPVDPGAAVQIASTQPAKKPTTVATTQLKPVTTSSKPVVTKPVVPVQVATQPVTVPTPVVTAPVEPVVTTPVPTTVVVAQPVETAPAIPTPEPTVIEDVLTTPYKFDTGRSYVAWKDSDDRTTLESQAVIEGDVASASVEVNGYSFVLQSKPDSVFVGSMTIPETSDSLFKVVLSPTLKVTMKDGQSFVEAIEWQNPKIVSETPWEKYLQTKSWLSKSIPVFEIVHWFYIAALVILSGALLISISIEVRKQHPHVIVQTLALLGMLVIYIKF